MKISNFYLDRNKHISILNKDLLNFLNNFVKKKEYKIFIKILEKELKLKKITLINETKIFLFSNFENINGKFNNIFRLIKLPQSIIICLITILYIKFFQLIRKNVNSKNFDVILDNFDRNNISKKYEKINKESNALFIFYDKKKYFLKYKLKFKNVFYFDYKNIFLNKNKEKSFHKLFLLLLMFTYLSIKSENNLIPIFTNFVKKYYKYNCIFNLFRSNAIIQDRFYDTSAIKDEIFHEYGGKKSCVIQKNLFQLNGPGMFVNADVLFSLGHKSFPNLKNFGCNIKKIIPVGSLFMESDYYNHPKYKNINKKYLYDMLIFSSSHTSKFHSGYSSYYDEYYEHFKWIKKIAEKYPKAKIAIKHKKNYSDIKEIRIFKGQKNIKYLVDKSNKYSDSYILGVRSKTLFTWSSTLGFEILSLKKNCFFLDPKNSNISFLPKNKVNNLLRITSFKNFERIFKKQLQKKNNKSKLNYNNYCLNSEETSKKILKYLENDKQI